MLDGAAEEGTPFVPPHGSRRYSLTPRPAGTRWVHTHAFAGADLHRGLFTGQAAIVYIEPASNPAHYDQEVFLATHEWEPFLGAQEMPTDKETWPQGTVPPPAADPRPNGYEVGYKSFSINGKSLGHGEPVRVKRGQRVMFRILNASATENIQLALPGHQFEVTALDGNPVPTPRKVSILALGSAERIDAVVEMTNPGVWILGTPRDDDRRDGMGIVVEYAGATGQPRWVAPPKAPWDYTQFGHSHAAPAPDEMIPMSFGKINGGTADFNRWTINGQVFEHSTPIQITSGRRTGIPHYPEDRRNARAPRPRQPAVQRHQVHAAAWIGHRGRHSERRRRPRLARRASEGQGRWTGRSGCLPRQHCRRVCQSAVANRRAGRSLRQANRSASAIGAV